MEDLNNRKNRSKWEHVTQPSRMNWIIGQLKANRYPNTTKVVEHFGVNLKTAQRTFDYMRDQAHIPIEYSAQNRGYFCTDPTVAMSVVEMTEGELVGMLLVERLAHQYRGSAIGRQVEHAVAKIMDALTEEISFDLDALMEAHSFEDVTSN